MNEKVLVLGNGVDWCEVSLKGLLKKYDVKLINRKIPVKGKMKSKIARVFFSYRLNKVINMPFKFLFYKDIKNEILNFDNKNDTLAILIYDHNVFGGESSFIKFLRMHFSNIKIAYIFTNIAKFTAANEKNYIDKLNDWYDTVFAFDPKDALKYGFNYSPLIYDADPSYSKEKTESTGNLAFYVGQAKDRLDGLLGVYKRLKELNIDSDFHIANVESGKQKFEDAIVYNQFMTYEDCVRHIQKATCLVDVIQGDSTGLTIKNCEAICYNKKLITTNKNITKYPFYDPRFIRVIEKPEDIDLAFFKDNRDVEYSKEGSAYFSADTFWDKLWGELS